MAKKKDILINVRDAAILTVSVYCLYELLWLILMEDPSDFLLAQNVDYMAGEFLFCTGFCAVSFLLNLRTGGIIGRRLKSVSMKTLLLTVGMLAVNFLWAWIYSLAVDALCLSLYGEPFTDMVDVYGMAVISTLVISLMLTARYVKAYVREAGQRKRERDWAIGLTVRSLQLQISPHFLFNNLSALSALMDIDRKEAESFITHMSLFYRHTLQNLSRRLIPLEDELKELDDYFFLIKTRFGDAIDIKVNGGAGRTGRMLPPGCLQLLVENCVKHNAFSRRQPLHISIDCTESSVTVTNDYRPLGAVPDSFRIGQRNVIERLRLLGSGEVSIKCDENTYSVTIPLMKMP